MFILSNVYLKKIFFIFVVFMSGLYLIDAHIEATTLRFSPEELALIRSNPELIAKIEACKKKESELLLLAGKKESNEESFLEKNQGFFFLVLLFSGVFGYLWFFQPFKLSDRLDHRELEKAEEDANPFNAAEVELIPDLRLVARELRETRQEVITVKQQAQAYYAGAQATDLRVNRFIDAVEAGRFAALEEKKQGSWWEGWKVPAAIIGAAWMLKGPSKDQVIKVSCCCSE